MSILNKQNISIVVDTYTDKQSGKEKKVWKTVGELITMQGKDGSYQFGKIWGAGGVTEFKIFEQDGRRSAVDSVNQPARPDIGDGDNIPF